VKTNTTDDLLRVQLELQHQVDEKIAGRVIRYVLIVAMPVEEPAAPEGELMISSCGNGTRRLTEKMIVDTYMKTELLPQLRIDVKGGRQ